MYNLRSGINVLCGVGILSTPYAVKEGGWLSLSILLVFAVLSWYTGILLRCCLDSEEGLETYPDIGQAAFGTTGRLVISVCTKHVNFLCPFTFNKPTDTLFFFYFCKLQIVLYLELYVSYT